MENKMQIKAIGKILVDKGSFSIQLDKKYIPALKNINGFGYLQIVWWGDKFDKPEYRSTLEVDKPYKSSPDKLGIFGTRSPVRPNPILITTIRVMQVDYDKGIIYTPYIDADNDTSILDIKPYHKVERIKDCDVPDWCSHWPDWYEEAATFNWEEEFNF